MSGRGASLCARPRGYRLEPHGFVDLEREAGGAIVIDIVDNSQRHKRAGLSALFDLPDALDLRGYSAIDVQGRLERLSREVPWVDVERIGDAGELEHAAERVYLIRFEAPAEIEMFTEFAWCSSPDGGYRLNLADGEWIDLRTDDLGRWIATVANATDGTLSMPRPHTDVGAALHEIDGLVRRKRATCVPFLALDAAWRTQ